MPWRPTGNPTIAIESTLPSLTTLSNNNQPTMVIQEDVVGLSEVGLTYQPFVNESCVTKLTLCRTSASSFVTPSCLA
jgi:hypothetical protein